MALQSMRKFKKLLKGGSRAKMTAADWREIRGTLGRDAGAGVRKKSNPTKAQKLAKARKASVERRAAVALRKYLKIKNPAMKTVGAAVQKLKRGVLKITPIKANAPKKKTGLFLKLSRFHQIPPRRKSTAKRGRK